MQEFKILDKVKWLLDYAEIYMFSSFPKVHLALKIKLEENMYSLIENIIRANLNPSFTDDKLKNHHFSLYL